MIRARSPLGAKYDLPVNRESAYEVLSRRTLERAAVEEQAHQEKPTGAADQSSPLSDLLWGTKRRQGMVETVAKQAARTIGSQIGRQILRGILGGIFGGSRR